MKLYVLTFGVGMVGGLFALANDPEGWRSDDSTNSTNIAPSQAVAKGNGHYPPPLDLHTGSRDDHRNPAPVDTAAFETVIVDPGMPVRIEHALDRRHILRESPRQPAR